MSDNHIPADLALGRRETVQDVFPDGAVVQVVTGDPAEGDATVVEVHPASVVVTDERLLALDGDLEWCWHLADVEAVHHATAEDWTIVAVPGVDDHGVAVAAQDRDRFRAALERILGHDHAPPGAGARDPLVEEHALEHHADIPDTHHVDHRDPQDLGDDEWATPDAPAGIPVALDPIGPGPVDATLDAVDDEAGVDGDHDHVGAAGLAAAGLAAGAGAALVTRDDLADPPGRTETAAALGADPTTVVDLTDPGGAGDDAPEETAPAGRRRFSRADRRAAAAAEAAALPLAGLEAREISAWFGTHHVLDRVSLVMEPGEVTALIGPSGCGKSTFLRILNRMHEMIPVASLAGEVLLDGEDIYDPQKKLTEARRQIGMVFQKPNPFPAMSIYDNVVAAYKLTGTKINHSEKDDVVESCLTKAGLWTEVRDRLRAPGGGLSGGQQQRLCIARALAIKPRVLLMDEPCSALDPTSTRRIEETIMELGSEVTIVIVTHNMQQAARVSDQCAFFLAEQGTPGVIVEHGPTDAMFHSPQDPRTYDYVNGRFG